MTVLLLLLITLQNMRHLELQVGGMCKERGATGTSEAYGTTQGSRSVNESVRESLLFSFEIYWTT